jgi:hypothetical protein
MSNIHIQPTPNRQPRSPRAAADTHPASRTKSKPTPPCCTRHQPHTPRAAPSHPPPIIMTGQHRGLLTWQGTARRKGTPKYGNLIITCIPGGHRHNPSRRWRLLCKGWRGIPAPPCGPYALGSFGWWCSHTPVAAQAAAGRQQQTKHITGQTAIAVLVLQLKRRELWQRHAICQMQTDPQLVTPSTPAQSCQVHTSQRHEPHGPHTQHQWSVTQQGCTGFRVQGLSSCGAVRPATETCLHCSGPLSPLGSTTPAHDAQLIQP